MKKLSLAIDSPAENNSNVSMRRHVIGLGDLSDDEDEGALINEANLKIDGGNFFAGQGASKKVKPSLQPLRGLAVETFAGNSNSEEYYNETESDNSRLRLRNPELAASFSEEEMSF